MERDDVQGNDALMKRITEEEPNLQFLCNKCNTTRAKETQWRMFLIQKQIDRFGRAQFKLPLDKRLSKETYAKVVEAGKLLLVNWVLSLELNAPGRYLGMLYQAADDLLL